MDPGKGRWSGTSRGKGEDDFPQALLRGSGADRKRKELASLLGEIFNAP